MPRSQNTDPHGDPLVYAADIPWKGLGADVSSLRDSKNPLPKMMKLAKVDWTVEAQPLYMKGKIGDTGFGDVEVPAQALVRSDTGHVLDVVGPSYIPAQNADAFEFFQEMLDAGDAKMESMGAVRNGQYVWAMADLGKSFEVGNKGDKVDGYLFVGVPHQQGKSLLFKSTSKRIWCNNMLARVIRSSSSLKFAGTDISEIRRSHRVAFDKAAMASVKNVLGMSRDNFEKLGEIANKLHKTKTDDKIAISILQPVFAPKFDTDKEAMTMDNLTPRMQQLMDILHKAPGAQPDTAWGILNAATYYNTHVAGKSGDRRFHQNMLAKGAAQSAEVLRLLTR